MILEYFFRFLSSFLDIFRIGKKSLTNRLNISVKSTKGDTVSVDLDPKWDIKDVKELVGPKLGIAPEDVEFILAGKVLEDSTIIEECDLGDRSILHAVVNKNVKKKSKPMNKTLVDLEEKGNVCHFFVYCKTCGDGEVREGKLRVRCSMCKSGAITVDRDPTCWQDVLQPKRISGHCQQIDCADGAVAWTEFYFKCSEHVPDQRVNEEATSLHLIRDNVLEIPCLACTDVLSPVLVFPCVDGHTICVECFLIYAKSRLKERRFIYDNNIGYTLLCPVGCENSLIPTSNFSLLPKDSYTQYQKFATEDCVLKSGGVLCPQPGCGFGIFPDEECNSVKCVCGFVFCKKCLQGNHTGDCESVAELRSKESFYEKMDPVRAAQSRWDDASRLTIRAKTKPCPECRTPTERAGGCMHMVCLRCNFEWCWVCQTEWTRECMGSHWFG